MSKFTGKWSISTNGEHFHGCFDSDAEAIAEGRAYNRKFWVGQCREPERPEDIFDVDDWLEQVWCHDDYQGDWAENALNPSKDMKDELEAEIATVIARWLDRHNLRPNFFVIEESSVQTQQEQT